MLGPIGEPFPIRGAAYRQAGNQREPRGQLKIMKSDSLRAELQDKYKEEYAAFEGELARLKAEKKGPLHIRDRIDMAGRLHEYDSSYGLFCLDSHNNTTALCGTRAVREARWHSRGFCIW